MSERLNYVSKEIEKHRNNLEKERIAALEADKARIEKEKQLLYDSGVISLMQEIVDAGLVKWSNNPVTKKEKLFFGGERDVVILNYTPAKIFLSYPEPSHSRKSEVFATLEFNYEYGYDSTDKCDAVKILVKNNDLYLASPHPNNLYSINYNPINNSRIAESIIEGIKHPIHHSISFPNNDECYLYVGYKTE